MCHGVQGPMVGTTIPIWPSDKVTGIKPRHARVMVGLYALHTRLNLLANFGLRDTLVAIKSADGATCCLG